MRTKEVNLRSYATIGRRHPVLCVAIAVLPGVPWLLLFLPSQAEPAFAAGVAYLMCLWCAVRLAVHRRLGWWRWSVVLWLSAGPVLPIFVVSHFWPKS